MAAEHLPGCDTRHTRRQRCNGAFSREPLTAETALTDTAPPELEVPNHEVKPETEAGRRWNGAIARVPMPSYRRLYLLFPDTGKRTGIYAMVAIVAAIAFRSDWYIALFSVLFVASMVEFRDWIGNRITFETRGLSIARPKQSELFITYALLESVEVNGRHRIALRYWDKPDWASDSSISLVELKIGDASALATDLERIVNEVTVGPALTVVRRLEPTVSAV